MAIRFQDYGAEDFPKPVMYLKGYASFCQHKCPVHLSCHGYLALIREHEFEKAYRVIRQKLPFPRTLGRVCNHPCETACNRGRLDVPVAIRDLKRFVADYAFIKGVAFQPKLMPKRPEKIAIIGSGPAGLAAGYDLLREGFQVVIFEALPVAGGLMGTGCPEFRLPKGVLQQEIDELKNLGVEIRLNHRVTNIESLFEQGYKAVFVATGASKGVKLPLPGVDHVAVLTGIDFLKSVNLGEEIRLGKRVLVIGGGGVAIDCARTALRLGREAYIACLESREKMPALPEDVTAAEEEGVIIYPSRTFTRIVSENGQVTGVECLLVQSMQIDREGKLCIESISKSQHTIPADTVIFAIGQVPQVDSLAYVNGVAISRNGRMMIDKDTLATPVPGVFAGGDVATSCGSIVGAIADGQRAALSIISYLNGEKPSAITIRRDDEIIPWPTDKIPDANLAAVSQVIRAAPPSLPIVSRRDSFEEVVHTYRDEQAIAEASRCVRCDLMVEGRVANDFHADDSTHGLGADEMYNRIIKESTRLSSGYYRRALLHNLGLSKRLKRKAEVCLSLGCSVFGMMSQVMHAFKLMDLMNIDYTYLYDEVCCGMGMVEGAKTMSELKKGNLYCEKLAKINIENASKVGADKLVYICSWCDYIANQFVRSSGLELLYFPDLLVRNIDKLRGLGLKLPQGTRIGYYEGCHIRNVGCAPDADIDWKSYRELVGTIEGVELIDLANWKCCTEYHDQILDEAQDKGAAYIVAPCAACWTWLDRYGHRGGRPWFGRVMQIQDILVKALDEKQQKESFTFPL